MPTDTDRIDFIIAQDAYLSYSRDRMSCNVWRRDMVSDGEPVEGWPQKSYSEPRTAIDHAIAFVKREEAKRKEEAERHRVAAEGKRFADAQNPGGFK